VTVPKSIRLNWLRTAAYTSDCTKEYKVELAQDWSLYAVIVPKSIRLNWLKTGVYMP